MKLWLNIRLPDGQKKEYMKKVKISTLKLQRYMSNLIPVVDTEWEIGYINAEGAPVTSDAHLRMKNFVAIRPGTRYIGYELIQCQVAIRLYDVNQVVIPGNFGRSSTADLTPIDFTAPSNARFMKLYVSKPGVTHLTPKSIYDFGISLTIG